MSEIAGRMAVQEGAKYLEKTYGGRGILLSGVPGVERGNVVILGGGNVGTNACKIATGMGANVTVLDVNGQALAYLDDIFPRQITTLYATGTTSAARWPGGSGDRRRPSARPGHPQARPPGGPGPDAAGRRRGGRGGGPGGCIATSHPTTHDGPHLCRGRHPPLLRGNMPGAVARTSTMALVNATLPYGLEAGRHGVEGACRADRGLLAGLNCYGGHCTCSAWPRP